MRLLNFSILTFVLLLGGCATTGPGGVQQQPPPQPFEARLLAQSLMSISLYAAKLDHGKLANLQAVLSQAKAVMALGLAKDPSSFETTSQAYLEGVDPVYQEMIAGLVQVFVLRLRPYIDHENPNSTLVNDYTQAILDGALLSASRYIARSSETLDAPLPNAED